jgi:extracellular elastinolytic metalloproteinase
VKGNGSTMRGPYAHVYADPHDDNVPDPVDEIASVSGLDWSVAAVLDEITSGQNCGPTHACTWDRNVANSWKTNKRQNAVQVYTYLNLFHDHLAAPPIGFSERLGNFQASNPSGQGKGHDAVQAQILDGAGTDHGLPDFFHYNNANMFTPPDGQAPTMQMYLFQRDQFTPDWPSGNAGDDASVVYHEYTHGLSSRLVTYPNGVQALNTQQSGAMGEAWSDWYAMDFLVDQGVITDTGGPGDVMMGEHITGDEGIRYQAIDCTVGAPSGSCPGATGTGAGGFTYGDYGKVYDGPEVHSDGEIWAQTLWDLRTALGVALAEKLITRAMLLSPPEPSFLDMRNAILQADVAYDGSGHLDEIWTVFAHRGMGYFASSVGGSDDTPTQDFSEPPVCGVDPCGSIHGTVRDSVTGQPVGGVIVAIGGHDAGFPGTDLIAKTGTDGKYSIAKVPFHTYEDVIFDRWGIEPLVVHDVKVDGSEGLSRPVKRDWAALDGGATVVRFTRPDYSAFGCGPIGAVDRALGSGWGSDAPQSTFGSTVTGPRSIVIHLPKTVDVTSFGVDAGATCGDPAAAGVKAFDIYTRTANGSWIRAVHVTSGAVAGRLGTYLPAAGQQDVRDVKFVMRSNHGDPLFMDMSELSVRGR